VKKPGFQVFAFSNATLYRYAEVTLLDQPSSAYFMQQDYKHFSPNLLPSFDQCLINSRVTTADESGRAFEGAFEAAVRPLPSGSRTTVAPRPAQAAAPGERDGCNVAPY
jgi:hypothetical protein